MAHVVRSNLFKLLNDLQTKTGKRYSWVYIGESLGGLSGQAAKDLFTGNVTDASYLKYGTMAALLDFFAAEGMPIEIGQLFTVTESEANE